MRKKMRMDVESLVGFALLGGGGGKRSAVELALLLLAFLAYNLPRRWLRALAEAVGSRASGVATRVICNRRVRGGWGYKDDADGNNNRLLQKAVIRNIDCSARRWPVSHAAFQSFAVSGRHAADEEQDADGSSRSAYFNSFRVVAIPPLDQWVQISDAVAFKRTLEVRSSGDDREETDTYFLRGKPEDVDDYIDQSVERYKKLLRSGDDGKRYVYMPTRRRDDLVFKRYALEDTRTFDTVHIPGKDRVIKVVDDFDEGRGKFAIPGFPNKLGFLLHGPPGTGKTSFVKALACHTRRHIVSIPLEKIRTNQELVSVFYDRRFRVADEDGGRHDLAFSEIVFVMEDVDAAGSAVSKRVDQQHDQNDRVPTKTKTKQQHEDALNLAGVLNVLDGPLDSPGRIVVITTNHPEKLDPALVRPGRVNMQIGLSNILPDDARCMINRYFGPGACDPLDPRLAAFDSGAVSPAALEAMCAHHDTADSLLREVRATTRTL